ncbi:MAG: hypothetical protein L0H59_10410, partial [Tomitella sp.]|nr:hypothetical protein [Tomitella sp.]
VLIVDYKTGRPPATIDEVHRTGRADATGADTREVFSGPVVAPGSLDPRSWSTGAHTRPTRRRS